MPVVDSRLWVHGGRETGELVLGSSFVVDGCEFIANVPRQVALSVPAQQEKGHSGDGGGG